MKFMRFWVIVFALSIFGNLKGVTWSEPERISSVGSSPELTINNDGICWCYGIYYYPSEALGWQQLETLPLIWGKSCFDKGDTLWLVEDINFDITYTRYDGENWSGIDTVPTNVYWGEGAKITADSSGGIWVGWTTEWGYYYWDVGYNRYKDGTWDEPKPVTDTLGKDENELWSMTTDSEGRVWFGWKNYYSPEDSNETPLVTAYYDDGFWSDEHTIWTKEGVWGWCLELTPDRVGGVWALWNCQEGTSFVLTSYWDGEAWSEPDTVADAGRLGGFSPWHWGKLAVDAFGNVWAVWRQALEVSDTYGDIYYSVNSGSDWSEPEPVDDDPAADNYPDIAVDGEGRIWCAWVSTRDGGGTYAAYTTSAGIGEEGFIQPPKSTIESILPNPFKSSTTIFYSVAGRLGSKENQYVELSIFDVTGRQVKALVSNKQSPAHYEIIWNGKDDKGLRCASGVYFIKMQSNEFDANERLVLLR